MKRKAIALLWVSLTAILFIGFVGLSLDTGLVVFTAEELQGAADASALAAAQFVKTDIPAARAAAVDLALLNRAGNSTVHLDPNIPNAADGDIVMGRFNRTTFEFIPDNTTPNAVKVVARRKSGEGAGELPLVFGRAFGRNSTFVERDAIAMLAGGTGSGLIALCSALPCAQRSDCANCPPEACDCSLYIHGNLTVSVLPAPPLNCDQEGAGVSVNSPNPDAFCAQGNATVITPNVEIYGGYDQTGNSVNIDNPCEEGPQPEPCGEGSIFQCETNHVICDPLRAVPVPSIVGLTDLGGIVMNAGDEQVIDPGYYSRGIRMTGGTLTMKPGVYVLGGAPNTGPPPRPTGFDIGGGAVVCGEGVMLFINGPTGELNINGNGCITLSPIDLDDSETPPTPCPDCDATDYDYPEPVAALSPYEGLTIFQSPGNCNVATIIGTSDLNMVGSLYFPCNHLNLSGTGDGFGNQLIARTLEISGDGLIQIHYDGRNPAFGTDTFLVE
ncbi:MAG TPA: pilus assembly protein TadG-related protein [Phycisphaerae bacterium]|nr:pilus assembly protein TadG-related protein [Phycisphaerae bacterium]